MERPGNPMNASQGSAAGRAAEVAQTVAANPRAAIGHPGPVLVAAILALVLVRLLVAASTGLTDDEAYYRLWALAPAMGYLDHPPMVGWMIAAGRWIAGDNALGVRLCAVVAALLGPFILWRTTALWFGVDIARRAVWIALAMPLLAVGGVIVTPDTPSVLFWGLAAWALAELHASRNANWWLAVGVFAGAGLLSKYSNLFFGAGIVLWLLLVPANRFWLRSWQLWAGGAIACALTLPVVQWNAQHEWASFAKQFGRVGEGEGLTLTYLGELVGGYSGLASPIIAGLGIAGLARVSRSAAANRGQAEVMLAAGVLPLLAYFLVHALHDRVQPNWMAPLYPALAVCAALALATLEPARSQVSLFGGLGKAALALGFALSAAIYLHAATPLLQSPRFKDPTDQMRGWNGLAAEVEKLRLDRGACWIATSSYATTGQLAYALRGKASVIQLDERIRYLHLPPADPALVRCAALYVELERRSAPGLLAERFRSVTLVSNLVRQYRGVPLATYRVYLVSEPIGASPLR
jgi:4-amino-4-deoxy-L-arabinose transferase-like glycosyltransferase